MTTEEVDFYEEFTKLMYVEYRRQAAVADATLSLYEAVSGTDETSDRIRKSADHFISMKDLAWDDLQEEQRNAFRSQTLMFFKVLQETGMRVVANEALHGTAN